MGVVNRTGKVLLACAWVLLGGCEQEVPAEDVAVTQAAIDVSEGPGPITSTMLHDRVRSVVYGNLDLWDKWLVVSAITPYGEGVFYFSNHAGGVFPESYHAFRMGSISKTFTGTLYAEQGDTTGPMRVRDCRDPNYPSDSRLSVKIAQICPTCVALPASRANLFIEMLATHNSGLGHSAPVHLCSRQDYFRSVTKTPNTPTFDDATCVRADAADSQGVPVGTFQYSNWGMGVLGQLMAEDYDRGTIGLQNFDDLVRAKLLTPLGMHQTFGPAENAPPRTVKAPQYRCTTIDNCPDEPEAPAPGLATELAGPAGNFWSTGPNMLTYLRYAMDLMPRTSANGRLLDVHDQIFCDRDSSSTGWMGLGWHRNLYGSDSRWHKGGDGGSYGAYITFSPAKGVGVVVLTNTGMEDSPKDVATAFMDLH